MSLNQPETKALGCIADGLAGSDPRLKMVSMDASRGSAPARPSAMQLRALVSGWLRLIVITSEAGAGAVPGPAAVTGGWLPPGP